MNIFETPGLIYHLGFLLFLFFLTVLFVVLSNDWIINSLEPFFNPTLIPMDPIPNAGINPCQEIECLNLYEFIRINAPMFTVIGITGTMLSLIPTFLDRFVGIEWKLFFIKDAIGLLGLVLIQIVFMSGCIFILFIAYLIIGRIHLCNFDQTPVHSLFGVNITRGDVQRWFFYLAFIPTIFSLLFFIMSIFTFQKDPMIQVINSVLLYLYLALLFFIGLLLVILVQPNNWTNTQQIKTICLFSLSIVFLVFFTILFSMLFPILSLFSPFDTHFNNTPEIIFSDANYSIQNSTSLGVPLTAGGLMALSKIDRESYLYVHWNTNFGYFISTDPATNISKIEGPDCVAKAYSTIYWTHDVSHIGKPKPPVYIFMTVENIRKTEFFNATPVIFYWKENDTLEVKHISLCSNVSDLTE